jgi:hypothetical protein
MKNKGTSAPLLWTQLVLLNEHRTRTVSAPADPTKFLGLAPDARLLGQDMSKLPEAEQRHLPVPSEQGRSMVLHAGVALTAASLIGGIVLLALGVILSLTGRLTLGHTLLMAVGGFLVATHWGWVHVAEFIRQGMEGHAGKEVQHEMAPWLSSIHPYTRYSVVTEVLDDGSIRIVRLRHDPIHTLPGKFSFSSERVQEETHSGDLPAEQIAERAETLRRQAALDTAEERERYEVAADAYETALLAKGGEQQETEARRAASAALSERINRNLREPPLVE